MTRYYPSSAAFQRGHLTFTDYNAGCLRKIYLNNAGYREALRQDTKDVGEANEVAFEEELKSKNLPYVREFVVKNEHFSGRIDFQLPDELIELKSTRSNTKRTRLRTEGPNTENIAQLVAYMVETETVNARLIYTYYGFDGRKKIPLKETYEFAVKIDDRGDIFINGQRYKFNVFDHLEHRGAVAGLDRSQDPGSIPRPYGYAESFGSPCHFCPFNRACEKLDSGLANTVEEFLQEAASCENIVKRESSVK